MLSFLKGHTPHVLASSHAHCFVGSFILAQSQTQLTEQSGFPLCDLQGGSFLQLHHLLCWEKMFSPPPPNEFVPQVVPQKKCSEILRCKAEFGGKLTGPGSHHQPFTHRPNLPASINSAQMFPNVSIACLPSSLSECSHPFSAILR